MAKFENRYGVRKIVYKQKCRCFCPIGKADYTNEFTVTMEPAEIIPRMSGRRKPGHRGSGQQAEEKAG